MKDNHKQQSEGNLQMAINRLPDYQPPEASWSEIRSGIAYQQALRKLPSYNPPDAIWEDILVSISSNKTRSLWKPALAAAAAILLLLWFQPWTLQRGNFQYHTESVDPVVWSYQNGTDEDAFEIANNWCEQHPFLCTRPDIAQLTIELQSLNEASQSLREALGEYGTDEHLIHQLTQVEMDRTKILKQFLDQILS